MSPRIPPRSTGLAALLLLAGVGGVVAVSRDAPAPDPEAPEAAKAPAEVSAARPAPAIHASPAAAPDPGGTWMERQVVVRPVGDLEELALRSGATVLRDVGRSGYAALEVPEWSTADAFVAELLAAGEIEDGAPQARVRGAGRAAERPSGAFESVQWGMRVSKPPAIQAGALTDVVVAVVDSGVAYADAVGADGTVYAGVASLDRSAVVAPWDFLDEDETAYDDHQHGTHIASIIASAGDVVGVAPGVGLMPLRVLDAQNQGMELDLVEALYWATDHGADVVNLSLSFGPDYSPSTALLDAIDYAASAGVALVGAAGNDGVSGVSWPAASPQVVAVGAMCPNREGTGPALAPYSNRGAALDLVAAGGCLDRDAWGELGSPDGYLDGILGESIALGQPDATGLWLMAGTSQAAAVVSGAMAHLVAAGHSPAVARLALQGTSKKWRGHGGFLSGKGGGRLQIDAALQLAAVLETRPDLLAIDYHVSLMPYLQDNGDGTVTPAARVTVLDAATLGTDRPSQGIATSVVGRIGGPNKGTVSCTLGEDHPDTCTLRGEPVSRTDRRGAERALAWRFRVDGVVVSNTVAFRPASLLHASDTLEGITDALQADPDYRDATLAFLWTGEGDSGVGPVAPALSMVHAGTGISTSPLGLVATPPALPRVGVVSDGTLDGTGITTSPLGITILDVPPFDPMAGEGISTSPLGLRVLALDAEDLLAGTGITTSPLGLKDLTRPEALPCATGCRVFADDPILLGAGVVATPEGISAEGTAIQAQLDAGGWSAPTAHRALGTGGTQEAVEVEVTEGTGLGEAIEFVTE